MTAKKLTVTVEPSEPVIRKPVPDDYFPMSFPTVAGTPDAPKPPSGFQGVIETFVTTPIERIVTELTKLHKKDPLMLVCVVGFGLTHTFLLNLLACVNTLAVVQKAFPGQDLLKKYLRLNCRIPRGDLPGNIFSHLVRKDGQKDFGLLDGFRWLGDFHQTMRLLKNEGRAYAHNKLLVVLVHNDAGALVPAVAWFGSPNFTNNAEKSFEMISRTTDIDLIWKLFDVFGYYWSLSEGLYNFSQGLTPSYTWLKKAEKFGTAPKCKSCGKGPLVPVWVDSDDTDYGPHRVLRCECGNTMPFLKEHQPVIR